jgi:mannosyl-oligosaccharide glucosidase
MQKARHDTAVEHSHLFQLSTLVMRMTRCLIAAALMVNSVILTGLCAKMDNEKSTVTQDPYFWGPYRSNLYFGIRATTPNSPFVGFMWQDMSHQDNFDSTLIYFQFSNKPLCRIALRVSFGR